MGKLGNSELREKKSYEIYSEFWGGKVPKLTSKHLLLGTSSVRWATVVTMVTAVRLRVNMSWRGFRSPCAETPRHQMSDDEVKDTQDGDDRRIDERSRKHLNDPTRLMLIPSYNWDPAQINETVDCSRESLRIMRLKVWGLTHSTGKLISELKMNDRRD